MSKRRDKSNAIPEKDSATPSQAMQVSGRLDQTRDRVLEIASRLFLLEGYGPVTVERVAREARVSKTTVYKFVRSKEQLFEISVALKANRRVVDDPLVVHDDDDLQPAFEKLGRNIVAVMTDPETLSLTRNVIAESSRFPQLAEAFHRASVTQFGRTRLIKWLEKLRADGRLQIDDASTAASQFLGMVRDAAMPRLLLGLSVKPRDLDRNAVAAADAFLKIYRPQCLQKSEKHV
ncbi:TetR/AcrR family transcriptional regulator [Derxia lacustris]|uniref:TetR/AcrR family transcriptional regulator n=1 Tax=Derxia lacustris TaxID=764842 RepID=UPI000A173C72|nr:TetR/AcrR family transcriptional regulator [Derxia lacustris]